MKTAEGKERGRRARHVGMILPYVMQGIYAVTDWFPDLPGWFAAIVLVASGGSIWAVIQHTRELCDKCLGQMPLDPDKTVKRNLRPLRLVHHMKNFLIATALVTVASVTMPKHWWETHVVSNIATLFFVYWIFAAMRHSKLEPWCPWCRDDGDGGHFTEVPDPTDDHSKPIPA